MTTVNQTIAEGGINLYSLSVNRISEETPTEVYLRCDVCQSSLARAVYDLPETRFQIVRCTECELGTIYPQPDFAEIVGFYPPRYYGADGRKFSGAIENLVRKVGARRASFLSRLMPRGGRVLDVGCGRGVMLQKLADRGHDAYGFEVNQSAVRGIDSRIRVRVGSDLKAADYEADFFDEVMVWHVLEHVPQPGEVIAEVHRILRPDGIAVVAVPNSASWQARWAGPAWFHLDPPRHLFHFPLAALRQLLEAEGFQVQSEHHFSLEQNPFGWIQSALNRFGCFRRNHLYEILHRRKLRTGRLPLLQLLLMFCLAPVAILLSILAAWFRQGATVHLVAKKIPREEHS